MIHQINDLFILFVLLPSLLLLCSEKSKHGNHNTAVGYDLHLVVLSVVKLEWSKIKILENVFSPSFLKHFFIAFTLCPQLLQLANHYIFRWPFGWLISSKLCFSLFKKFLKEIEEYEHPNIGGAMTKYQPLSPWHSQGSTLDSERG